MTASTSTAVVGAGRMGTGIAHALLLAGAEVVLVDSTPEALQRGLEKVRSMVARSAERGLDVSPDAVLDGLRGGVSATDVAGAALVVEAVPEIPALKVEILAGLEAVLDDDAVLASNTSSISIDELAAALTRPGRFLGHALLQPGSGQSSWSRSSPVRATEDSATDVARGWTEAMGKTAIVVTDSPGFASSRLGVAIGLEAIRMVEEGVASRGGYRRGHGAWLQVPGRSAAADRHGRPRRPTRDCGVPRTNPRPALRATRADA